MERKLTFNVALNNLKENYLGFLFILDTFVKLERKIRLCSLLSQYV